MEFKGYSGKSVKFASLQLFNFPIFMVWVVVPYLQLSLIHICCFSRRQFVCAVLLDREVIRVTGFQLVEHLVHGILEGLIVLSGFRGIDRCV